MVAPWLRRGLALGLVAAGAYVAYDRRTQLGKAMDLLDHPEWPWLLAAIAAQASSMVAFARLQRWLLRCGGVRVRLRDMIEITLAGNALSTSLPGGAAWAATWIWGQLRRRSVSRVLATWVVLVAGALASFALFLLLVAGALIAGSRGPVASLRWLGVGLLAAAVALIAAAVAIGRSATLRRRWEALQSRAAGRSGLPWKALRGMDSFAGRVRAVTPSPLAWAESFGLAIYNWAADLATLVFGIKALGVQVPWRGIVIAYALTQIAASIPITPGGLAVVEGSLTALLAAYGMPATEAVGVVILYRVVSFWALVPIGWGSWGYLELAQRRQGAGSMRRHPWVEHCHGEGAAAVGRRRQGPERLLRSAPCEGCGEPLPEPVSSSHYGPGGRARRGGRGAPDEPAATV